MPKKNPGFIDVDQLQPQVSLDQAAQAYGYALQTSGKREERIACPFQCDGCQPGSKNVSVNTANPVKTWKCHNYQCDAQGKLIDLMYGFKHGTRPSGGRLKGDEFREIAQDLQTIVGGERPLATVSPPEAKAQAVTNAPVAAPSISEKQNNVPLIRSERDNVQALATLDDLFTRDIADMNEHASLYIRQRPWLSEEVMKRFRMGYLPSGLSDKRGFTLRACIVYPQLNESGEVLAWIGRDPAYQEKHAAWLASDRSEPEPKKHRFPKGYFRGQEFFGQEMFAHPEAIQLSRQTGLVIVEGFNDMARLWTMRQPSLALGSNEISNGQIERLPEFCHKREISTVTLMLDCQPTGDQGAKEALWKIAQSGLNVKLAWSQQMHDGKYSGMQPEELTEEQWNHIRNSLLAG